MPILPKLLIVSTHLGHLTSCVLVTTSSFPLVICTYFCFVTTIIVYLSKCSLQPGSGLNEEKVETGSSSSISAININQAKSRPSTVYLNGTVEA